MKRHFRRQAKKKKRPHLSQYMDEMYVYVCAKVWDIECVSVACFSQQPVPELSSDFDIIILLRLQL